MYIIRRYKSSTLKLFTIGSIIYVFFEDSFYLFERDVRIQLKGFDLTIAQSPRMPSSLSFQRYNQQLWWLIYGIHSVRLTFPLKAGNFESMIIFSKKWDMLAPWRVFTIGSSKTTRASHWDHDKHRKTVKPRWDEFLQWSWCVAHHTLLVTKKQRHGKSAIGYPKSHPKCWNWHHFLLFFTKKKW